MVPYALSIVARAREQLCACARSKLQPHVHVQSRDACARDLNARLSLPSPAAAELVILHAAFLTRAVCNFPALALQALCSALTSSQSRMRADILFVIVGACFASCADAVDCQSTVSVTLANCDRWIACKASKGLKCDALGNIGPALVIYLKNVSGPIPGADLAAMTGLTELYVHGDRALDGPIPKEIGLLTNLGSLGLRGNLTGTIPSEIGELTGVGFLWLYDNALTGPIPSEIGKMTSLKQLDLNNNTLTGPIPSAVGDLRELFLLDVSGNQLTGAEAGICPILGNTNWDLCTLSPNPAWTDGAECPTCLNNGPCKPPIECSAAGSK